MFESPPYFVFPFNADPKFVHSECGEADPSDGNALGMTMRQLYKAVAMVGMLASDPCVDAADTRDLIRAHVLAAAKFADAQISEDKEFEKKGTDE